MATTTKLVELFNADETIAALSTQAFVEAAYENLLGLSGDFSNKDARVAYWVAKIDAGLATADFAATFLAAAAVQGDLLTDAEFAANTAALAAVAALDETGLTLEAVKAAAVASAEEETEEPVVEGQTFTLTTSTSGDIFSGTAGNDTFNGASGTVTASDILIDASATDADVANLVVTGTGNPQFTAANIETVNLNFELGASADVTKVSGSTVINIAAETAGNTAATVLGLGSAAKNIATSSDIATLGIQGTSATTDSVKVTVGKSAVALTESATEIENIEVATSETASTVTLDVLSTTTVTKVTASGDADLTLVESAASEFALTNVASITDNMDEGAALTVKSVATATVDYSGVASTATLQLAGALTGATVTLNNAQSSVKHSTAAAGAVTLAAKSGSSNTLNLLQTVDQTQNITLSGYSTLNLTASQADGTAWTTSGNLVASGVTVNYTGDTNIELNGANTWSAFNASEATGGVTALLASTATSLTGGAGKDHVDLATDISFTFAGGEGVDTLDLSAALDLSDNDVQLSSVEVIDVQDVNGATVLAAAHVSGQTLSFLGTGGNDTVEVALVSTGGVANLSGVSQSGIQTFTITGGAGADVITGTKGADVITGGAGADTLSGNEGADTITAGAGNDTIDLTENTAAVDTVVFSAVASNGKDTITGFAAGTGGDLLKVSALATTVAGETAIAANASTTDLTDDFVAVFANGADGAGDEAIADYTDMTDVAAFLAAGLTEADAEDYVAVINDVANGMAYVYNIDVNAVSATADLIESGDVTLVGIVSISNGAVITTANTDFS